jgi:AcrR family transcriptional regulator
MSNFMAYGLSLFGSTANTMRLHCIERGVRMQCDRMGKAWGRPGESLGKAREEEKGARMPKVVDHEDRRRRLAEAVWELTLREGLEGVTLRKVAAEAGVSMGQVQHYHPSREEMVRDAVARAVTALNARIETAVKAAAAGQEAGAEVILRECLYAMLGRDEEGARLLRLSVAVLGRAVSDPSMARVLAPGDGELLDFTAGLIAGARAQRGTQVAGDPRTDADICWSVATSLGVDVALGMRTAVAARGVLDYHLEGVLGRS